MTHKTKADIYLWAALLMVLTPVGIVIGSKVYDVYHQDPGLVVFGFVVLFWFAMIGMFMSLSEAERKKSW